MTSDPTVALERTTLSIRHSVFAKGRKEGRTYEAFPMAVCPKDEIVQKNPDFAKKLILLGTGQLALSFLGLMWTTRFGSTRIDVMG